MAEQVVSQQLDLKRTLFDALKWLLALSFGAGLTYGSFAFETKDHADEVFMKKEVFSEVQKSIEKQNEVETKKLDALEVKLDWLIQHKR